MTDIIIPSYKTPEECKELIEAIEKTRVTKGKLIFIGQQASASVNRNYGLDKATTKYQIMLDDDITGFYKGWDEDLIYPMKEDENLIMVSARLLKVNGTPAFMFSGNYDVKTKLVVLDKKELPTSCFAYRRNDLRYDENFVGSGFEDNDYCRQLALEYPLGKFAINNDCKLIHLNEMKNQKGDNWLKNKKYFCQKWNEKDIWHN